MQRYMLIFFLLFCSRLAVAQDGVWVIANVPDQNFALTKAEVRNLFMSSGISSGDALIPVAMSPGNRARAIFNTKIIALPESRVQSYWAQMRFSGRQIPPIEVSNLNALLDHVTNTEGAIGYVPSGTVLPENVKVVYRSL